MTGLSSIRKTMNSVVVDGMNEAQFFFILPPNCHMPDDNRAVQKETIQNNGGQVPADKYGLAKTSCMPDGRHRSS